jgi:hypothetical protein
MAEKTRGEKFLLELRDSKDDNARATTALRMIESADVFRQRAKVLALQGYAYKHNQYRVKVEGQPSRRDMRLVADRTGQKTLTYHSINWSYGAAQNRIGKWLAFEPDPVFSMDTGREDDRMVADVCARAWRKMMAEKVALLMEEVADTAAYIGRPIVKKTWDPRGGIAVREERETFERTNFFLREVMDHKVKIGKIKMFKGKKRLYQAVDPKSDLPLWTERMTGCPDFITLDATSFNLDPSAKAGVRAANWAMDQLVLPSSYFYETYPEHAAKFDAFDWSPSVALDETEVAIRGLSQLPDSSDYVACGVLTDLYIRPIESLLPDGLNLLILSTNNGANGPMILLEPGDKPIGTPRCDLPYIDDFFEVKDRNYWSFTQNHVASYAQRVSNTHMSIAAAAAEAGAKVILFAKSQGEKDKGIKASTIAGLPNGILVVAGPDFPIEGVNLQILQNAQTVPTQGWMMDKAIALSQASTANAGNTGPNNEDFSSQVARAMQSDSTATGMVIRRWWRGYKRLMLLGLEDIQEKCSEKDLLDGLLAEMGSKNRLPGVRKFRSADLRGHLKIEPKFGLASESDEAMLMGFLKFSAQYGGQATDPQEIMDLLMRRRKFGTTCRDVNIDRANEENDLLWEKRIAPDRFNDHRAHIYTHKTYYNDHYDEMSEKQRMNFRLHIEGHENLEIKVAGEKARKLAKVQAEVQADIQKMTGASPETVARAGGQSAPSRRSMAARTEDATGTAPAAEEG